MRPSGHEPSSASGSPLSKRGDPISKGGSTAAAIRCVKRCQTGRERAWQSLASGLKLPDPDDIHVLAAALAGRADCIVTTNLRDFPPEVVGPLGIEIIHPDQFVVAQWDLDQLVAVAAFKRMRARWKKPEATAEDFAAALERAGLPATAQRLREAAELI
jgi:hypothetical protein